MAEKPILFSGPMVSAILEGRKTMTRRVMKPQPRADYTLSPLMKAKEYLGPRMCGKMGCYVTGQLDWTFFCPAYQPGDHLWVKENYQYADWTEDGLPFIRYQADGAIRGPLTPSEDMADRVWAIWEELSDPDNRAIDGKSADRKWRPSIFMPKWAARIWLEVTDVRAERLQDISEEDAIAEGVAPHLEGWYPYGRAILFWKGARADVPAQCCVNAKDSFEGLWDSLNAKRGFPWSANPWVWAYTFRRVEP